MTKITKTICDYTGEELDNHTKIKLEELVHNHGGITFSTKETAHISPSVAEELFGGSTRSVSVVVCHGTIVGYIYKHGLISERSIEPLDADEKSKIREIFDGKT